MITQAAPGSERRAVPRPQRVDPVAVAGGLVLAPAAFAVALSARRRERRSVGFVYLNGHRSY